MKSMKQIVRQLESKKKQLAKTRDELRELEAEISEHADIAEQSCDELGGCIDTLSQYL